MKTKIIAIEGLDGVGKETQSIMLMNYLKNKGYTVEMVSFPQYKDESSVYCRRYLSGKYGNNAEDVSGKEAALFYALDRYDYFKSKFNEDLDYLICDRYVWSNALYQSIKYKKIETQNQVIGYILNLEYNILKIPKDDICLFLDLSEERSSKNRKDRCNKIDNSRVQDIHESNDVLLSKVYKSSKNMCRKFRWNEIKCEDDDKVILSRDIINQKIIKCLESKGIINK